MFGWWGGSAGCEQQNLIVLDELFRGTNAIERIAAAQAVLTELTEGEPGSRPHVVLGGDPRRRARGSPVAPPTRRTISVTRSARTGWFSIIASGGAQLTRNAIALLRLHGAPEALTTSALACAAELDRQRGTTVVGR